MNKKEIGSIKRLIFGEVCEIYSNREIERAAELKVDLFNHQAWLLESFSITADGYFTSLKYKDKVSSPRFLIEDLEDCASLLVFAKGSRPIIISDGRITRERRKVEVNLHASFSESKESFAYITTDVGENPYVFDEPGTVLTKQEALEKGWKTFEPCKRDNFNFIFELLNK